MDQSIVLPWTVALGVVAACTIFSNLLMTAVFITSRAVRRMRTALFLMGMTAADLVVGVAAIPMYMARLWPNSSIGGQLMHLHVSIEITASFASIFLLAVVALERVYSVFRPYRHRVLSKTPYWVGLLMSWFLAALPAVFRVLTFIPGRNRHLLTMAFMAVVPIVIVVSYVAIWWKLKTTRVEGLHQRRDLQERKMAKTLAILTGVFLVAWLPFSIMTGLARFGFHFILQGLSLEDHHHILYTFKVLHYSNSFMNPVIYSFRIPQVRSALGKIFRGHSDELVAPGGLQMGVRRRGIEGGNGGEDEGEGDEGGRKGGSGGGEGGGGGSGELGREGGGRGGEDRVAEEEDEREGKSAVGEGKDGVEGGEGRVAGVESEDGVGGGPEGKEKGLEWEAQRPEWGEERVSGRRGKRRGLSGSRGGGSTSGRVNKLGDSFT